MATGMTTWLRWTVLFAIALFLMQASASAQRAAVSFEQLTISTTAIGWASTTVAPAANAPEVTYCVGILETADVRYGVDGTNPTSSVGHLLRAGDQLEVVGIDNIRRFRAIRAGSTNGVLPTTCYQGR